MQSRTRVQLLSVPNCPLVTPLRKVLEKCLAQIPVDITLEELVGDYSSPTLLVNGFDVTGSPRTQDGVMSCRLDTPTEEQILAALRGLAVLSCASELERQIEAAAFQTLLRTAMPVSIDHLAKTMERSAVTISNCISELRRVNRVRLDSSGYIIGIVGLSLTPTVHELVINGTRFWAWCAFDVIGIFGALYASGSARSLDPFSNEIIPLEFMNGIPQDGNLTIFMADLPNKGSVCDSWCSKVNFFTSVQSAKAWSQANDATGCLISVGALVPVAREVWSGFVPKEIVE